MQNPLFKELFFPGGILRNAQDRALLHKMAEKRGLAHSSEGNVDWYKSMTLTKPDRPRASDARKHKAAKKLTQVDGPDIAKLHELLKNAVKAKVKKDVVQVLNLLSQQTFTVPDIKVRGVFMMILYCTNDVSLARRHWKDNPAPDEGVKQKSI